MRLGLRARSFRVVIGVVCCGIWGNISYMDDSTQTMGQRIRAARQRGQVSQRDLGDRIGVSASTISQWETGGVRGLESRALRAIARVLDVNEEWLSHGTGPIEVDVAGTVTRVAGGPSRSAGQAEHTTAPNDDETHPARQWLPSENSPPTRRTSRAGLSICGQCGSVGKPKKTAGGSFIVELALWLCFIVPGLIYSLWRVSTKRPTCRSCGAIYTMVPLHTPRGRQLAAEFDPAPGSRRAPVTSRPPY